MQNYMAFAGFDPGKADLPRHLHRSPIFLNIGNVELRAHGTNHQDAISAQASTIGLACGPGWMRASPTIIHKYIHIITVLPDFAATEMEAHWSRSLLVGTSQSAIGDQHR